MKQLTFLIAFVAISVNSFACGPYWTAEEYYYHIFDQKRMIDPSYIPFIHYEDRLFYDEFTHNDVNLDYNRNYNDWATHFNGKLTAKQVYQLLVRTSIEEIEESNLIPMAKKEKFVAYAKLAREVDNRTQVTYDEVWEPSIRKTDYDELANEIKQKITSADSFYQLRYAYQLSKLAFREGEQSYMNWIAENVLKNANQDQAIYYYLQDHQAAFLRKNNPAKATAHYIKSFVNLPERRLSTMNSVRFTLNPEMLSQVEQYLDTPEEKQALLFINAFEQRLASVDILEKMIALDPNSELTNLVLARALNEELRLNKENTFRKINHIVCNDNQSAFKPFQAVEIDYYYDEDEPKASELNKLQGIIEKAISNKVGDTERWNLALAQVEFLKNNSARSQILVNKALQSKNSIIKNQALLLNTYNKLAAYNQVGDREEKELAGLLKQVVEVRNQANPKIGQEDFYYWDYETDFAYDAEDLFWHMLSQAYYNQGDYAKSFLAANTIESLNHYRDPCVIEDLIQFTNRKNHSAFEKTLVDRIGHPKPVAVLKDYLAATHVANFQLDKAIALYKEINKMTSSGEQNEILYYTNIPKNIFATTRWACYGCEFDTNLTQNQPTAVQEGVFATKLELMQEVARLRKSSKPVDQLAYGNFLLNINRKGYYRNLFGYTDNGVNDHFVRELDEYGWGHVLPISYEETANVFRFVLSSKNATNEEKAMAAWGIARAEQGIIEDEDSPEMKSIRDSYDYRSNNYVELFTNTTSMSKAYEELYEYRESQFAKEIIEECGYYQYFVNHR